MAVFRRHLLLVPQDVRSHDERTTWKVHFFLTFVFLNGTFYLMHILGARGFRDVSPILTTTRRFQTCSR